MADAGLRLKQWPGESSALVYDPRSSTTHLLDGLGWEVLRCAQAGPVTLQGLAAALNGASAEATPVAGCAATLSPAPNASPGPSGVRFDDDSDPFTADELAPTVQHLVRAGLLHHAA